MKKLLLVACLFVASVLNAQIVITQNELPHSGDSLYRTRAGINPFLNYAATGSNHVWNFTNLTATSQDSALYQTVSSTNFVYALTYADIFFNPNRANHAKAGVDIPFNNLLPISNPYTFYYRSNSLYKTVGFGVELAGIPVPIIFTDHDEIYSLPLNFGDTDSSHSSYNLSLPTLAYYGYEQSRLNEVDGWGTINSPAGSFDALRVKTTIFGKDTLSVDTLSLGFSIVRPVVREYKWLTTNLRIPVLQVNTTELFGIEIISDIFFYDLPRSIVIVPPLGNVICPGNSLNINYSVTGVFNQGGIFVPGNIFRAQLSDVTGDFTNAVNIGSVTATQSGVISCTIPANTPPGTGYRIRVISTSPAFTGNDNGFDLTIGQLPVVTVQAGGATEFCEGGSVSLSASTDPTYSYQWQLDGVDITGAISSDYVAATAGNYTVVVSNACGISSSVPIAVIVHPLPVHNFSQASFLLCDSSQLTITALNQSGQFTLNYQWYIDGNLLAGETNDSITTSQAGNYTLEITNTVTGCVYTDSVSLTVDIVAVPQVNVTGNTIFCTGDSVLLDVTTIPGLSYQWQLNGINIPGAVGGNLAAVLSGTYTVMATSVNGCTSASSPGINVTSNPSPAPTIISSTGNTVFCFGDSAVLNFIAVIGFNYQWTYNGINIPGAIFNQLTVLDSSGIYSVVVTDMAGCTSDAANPTQVIVNPLPSAPLISQSNDTLYASGAGNFQWYLDGNIIPGATGPYHIPLVNGNYTVTVSDSNGCENVSVIYPVTNVGINEMGMLTLGIYPNPSNGFFMMSFSGFHIQKTRFTIIDPAGKELVSGLVTRKTELLDISRFADGIYILLVQHPEKDSRHYKIIKQ